MSAMVRGLARATLVVLSIGVPCAHAEQCTPLGPPGPDSLWGAARGIDFDASNIVHEVLMGVPPHALRPWLADQLGLDITITSLNGEFHHHGSQIVPISDTTLFSTSGPDLVNVVVTWTADTIPITTTDTYTVQSQLIDLATSTPLTPAQFVDYGPF